MARKVDQNALRTNQAFIIALLLLAFIADAPLLVAFVSVVLAVGIVEDNPEPHNFSQGLGATFTGLSFVTLVAGVTGLGWALSWLVIVLAALNLFAGFCAGCFMYYQLSRRNVPGFVHLPVNE
jgi:hypothetical protein